MSETVERIVIGSTRKRLRVPLTDENGAPISIAGGSAKLQGTSADLPSLEIDQSGTIYDAASGIFEWDHLGSDDYVSLTDIGTKSEATVDLRVKYTDAATDVDYTDVFQLIWEKPPIVPAGP